MSSTTHRSRAVVSVMLAGIAGRIFSSSVVPGTGILAVGDVYMNGYSGRGVILQRC